MSLPEVVSVDEWLVARKKLLAAEEQAGSLLAEISEQRRQMPATAVDKEYVFEGPAGTASLLEVFEGRQQLIIQHFMFHPDWDQGCPYCSYQADSVGHLAHLHARNTTFAVVSRAPIAKIERFRVRMGWTFPWYSSLGSDFNYDFHVTHADGGPFEYNYRTAEELIERGDGVFAGPGEKGGLSVFVRDGESVLHTYSEYGSVTGLLLGSEQYLDLTPLGQQEVPMRHHDRYSPVADG